MGLLKFSEKVNALKGTLENLQAYFKRLHKVHPKTSPIKLCQEYNGTYCSSQYPVTDGKEIPDTDIYISLYARTFRGSSASTFASCGSYIVSSANRKPFQGFMNVKIAKFSSKVDNVDQLIPDVN